MMHLSWARCAFTALLCAVLLVSCGPKQQSQQAQASSNAPAAPNPNVPTAAEQQFVFSNAQFTAPILLHVPPDDFPSSQVLARENGSTVEWWAFNGSNIGCVQQGYATTIGFPPLPAVDGYNFDGHTLENVLEGAGVRAIQSYSLTLNPTPWGSIERSFSCTITTGSMAPFAQGQDLHGALTIPLAQRVCSRWTFVNHYQNAVPGQGNAQVFAGTFAYTMKPLVDGARFSGDGTASIKMYLNPDNGQWTVLSFEQHDPQLSFTGFAGVEQAAPVQTSCAGP